MTETPDWILEMCARFMFELSMVTYLTANGREDDKDRDPERPDEDWEKLPATDRQPWLKAAWGLLVEEATGATVFELMNKEGLGPIGLNLLRWQVSEECIAARRLASELRALSISLRMRVSSRAETYARARAENQALHEGPPGLFDFLTRFHAAENEYAGAVGGMYDKGSWRALEAEALKAWTHAAQAITLMRANELAAGKLQTHAHTCTFRCAVTGAVPIECDHGFDVCGTCDKCTCGVSP